MITYEQIEKIFSILYLNEDKIQDLKTIGYKYNGFSHYGPYEDDSLNENRLLTINGNGSIILHNDGKITTNTLIIYIAGNSSDHDYRINEDQLYSLSVVIEIFKKKISKNTVFVIDSDLSNDYDSSKFDLYRNCVRDLLVSIE